MRASFSSSNSPDNDGSAGENRPGKPQSAVGAPAVNASLAHDARHAVQPSLQYGVSTKQPFCDAAGSHASPASSTPLPQAVPGSVDEVLEVEVVDVTVVEGPQASTPLLQHARHARPSARHASRCGCTA